MDRLSESEIEDALARVLFDAYNSARSTRLVERDEQVLRNALFGEEKIKRQEIAIMAKPDWKDAPEGMRYLAQDADGDWFWWKAKPVVSEIDDFWMPTKFPSTHARAGRDLPNPGWTKTLERRP